MDKNKEISELEEQYIKVISLEGNLNLKCNPAGFTEKIENFKQDLINTRGKRNEAQTSNLNMVTDNSDYESKTNALRKRMEDMIQNTSSLTATKEEYSESTYNDDLHQLKDAMHSLQSKRRALDQHAGVLSGAMEELEELGKQLSEFMDDASKGKKYIHDKSCPCDLCMFERELTYEMITNRTQTYLKSLIKENEIEKVKLALDLGKEIIINLKDDKGFHLLMSLTVEYGTLKNENLDSENDARK